MTFPETRQTLIQRLATTSGEDDWRQFLNDYWGPVCRFAAVRASLSATDAEDIASLTFEAILTNRLLGAVDAESIVQAAYIALHSRPQHHFESSPRKSGARTDFA